MCGRDWRGGSSEGMEPKAEHLNGTLKWRVPFNVEFSFENSLIYLCARAPMNCTAPKSEDLVVVQL